MIVITTDVVSSDGMTTVASSTVSAPESTSDGTLPRSTPETPLTTEPPSQTIGTTTEWVSTIETSTATSTISTQEGGSSRTNDVLTTPTQTGSDKQDTSQIASGADVITEVMCRQPVLPPHTVVRGNGRYYVWSVVILACSSIRYTFPEGGAQRTLICLPNGQWHVNITNGCVGK
ncbi:hypothetical protein LSH36_235g01016 [Paralvinella palmiformis]|uniref:Sushi domain-containing protein n=1 Tax=Paralvinella palmiformis TaxID=53620 RepID=A0AAD9JLW9_9ANNE|nr:hypothetical protein LSH36_235g01016 [Paralvinella palmiformis]